MFGELNVSLNSNSVLQLVFQPYVACAAVFLVTLYWYTTRNHNYWKKVGIPYVKPWPLIGSVILNLRKPAHETDLERYKKYGRIYGYYEGNRPALILAEPELLKQVFLKDFHLFPNRRWMNSNDPVRENMLSNIRGEQWKRIRSIVSPTFSTGKMKRMLGIFDECAGTLHNNFLEAAKEGRAIEAIALFGAFSFDVIASSAFSTKLDSHNDPNNLFVRAAKQGFNNKLDWKFVLRICAPPLARLFGAAALESKATNFFRDISLHIIQERKRTGETRNDLLQLLLDACKEVDQDEDVKEDSSGIDDNYTQEGNDEQIIKKSYKKKPLSTDELLAQCVIFFLSGFETVTTAMALMAFHIAMDSEIQDTLITEIDQSLNDHGGVLTYEAIQQMKYMDNVISETLRMHPPAIRVERVAAEDYTLGETGITIPKGTLVGSPVYAMHWDPEYYPEPERFDPDRFCIEERMKRPAFTYMPFGGGPRNCVARRFALLEMKVCFARVLSRFRFSIDPKTKVPLEFDFSPILMQPKDILLRLQIRDEVQQ